MRRSYLLRTRYDIKLFCSKGINPFRIINTCSLSQVLKNPCFRRVNGGGDGARARAHIHQQHTQHYIPMRYNTILLLLLLTERTPSRSHCRLNAYSPLAGARDSRQFDAEPRVSQLARRSSYGTKYPKSLTTKYKAGRPRFRNRVSIVVFEDD